MESKRLTQLSIQRITEADVIKAAESEGKEVLLVFASSRALIPPDEDEDDYPAALKVGPTHQVTPS